MKNNFKILNPCLLAIFCGISPLVSQASGGGGEGKNAATYPGYLPLTPSIVVNLSNPRRSQYLKLDVQFFIATSHDAELVTEHLPLIRDRMVSLLGGRQPDQLMSVEAREQLRVELLAKLREIMVEHTGEPAITEIYFTGFLIQ